MSKEAGPLAAFFGSCGAVRAFVGGVSGLSDWRLDGAYNDSLTPAGVLGVSQPPLSRDGTTHTAFLESPCNAGAQRASDRSLDEYGDPRLEVRRFD